MTKKRIWLIIIITFIVAAILSFMVAYTIRSVDTRTTNYCYNQLANASQNLADDLVNTTDMDRTILSAMSTIIAGDENITKQSILDVMNSYDPTASYVSYVELLDSKNMLLNQNGTVTDANGYLDFQTEAQKGLYVSEMQEDVKGNEVIVRNAVPVVKDGKTVYILYGVISLADFSQSYTTDIYNNKAFVYMLNGDTGDFMLDTWHKTLGNIRDVSKRKMVDGYNFDDAIINMKNGISGNLGFVSNTTGDILYMHYEPIGINNWVVGVTVQKTDAFKENQDINSDLYKMAANIGGVMLAYMISVIACLSLAYRQVKKLGTQDQTTNLKNRNAYDKYMSDNQNTSFEKIICIYIDANGLHEINNKFGHATGDHMLRVIAGTLKNQFSDKCVYRIGGDEFVVFTDNLEADECNEKMEKATKEIEKHDYTISSGVICRTNEIGLERITKEADELMLKNKKEYYKTHERRQARS